MAHQLLTVKEIAALRRRTKWTVYRWVREGYLHPTAKDFGRLLFHRSELTKLPQHTQPLRTR